MKKFLAGLVSLLMLSTAFAEPTITHLGYTAYLGSSNELYLQDPTGTVRVLRYPIADILSITDTVVYCRAQDGKLLSIALDGSQSLIIAETPTDEQVNALTAKSSYTLTDGVLRNGATIVDTGVLAFCDLADEQTTTAPDELLYLKQNTTNTAALMVRTENVATARTLAILGITAPVLSMTANGENITIVASDHSVTVYNRVALTTTNYPATSELTEKASAIGSELFRYAPAESFGWNVEISTGLPAIEVVTDRGNVSVATATPAPAVPTATARPTATVRPTATPRPTATATAASEYTRLNYGSKGKAVRKLQNRLSKLGYPVGKVDGVWGDDTQFAVNLFQSAIGYTEHRYASAAMQEKLYSKKAPVYDPYMPLKEGKKGTPVKLMQQRLFDLGYFTTNDVEKEVDGVYGKRTTEAIKLFQTVCGYEEKKITGVADADTLMLLFDEKAPVNPGNVPPTPTSPVVIVTPTPTNVPTATPAPTNAPTAIPEPTEAPTATPTPTNAPTAIPEPTEAPTATPAPTEVPTEVPTATPAPTEAPTATPAPTDTVEVITPEPQPSETVTE